MTSETRFERDLPAILEDLYLGPAPDYRHEVVAVAVRRRQRPPWTFPGRWFPMADIASRPALAARVPWRAVGLAALIIALTLAVAVLVAGSRQTRLPSPFGLAENGLVVYAIDGDIHTLDPATGQTVAVITDPAEDFDPVFSPDGTRIAFRRTTIVDGSPVEHILVTAADGSGPVVVTGQLDEVPGYFEWAPDSRSILLEEANGKGVWMLDAVTPSEPRVVATNANTSLRPFRPPTGDEVLINRRVDSVTQVVLLDLASGRETVLVTGNPAQEVGGERWSPDGQHVIYVVQPADAPDTRRIVILDVDSGASITIPGTSRNHFDIDPVWSHDGSMIAFSRWEQIDGDTWDVRPIMLYSVASGRVREVGPRARDIRAAKPSEFDSFASAGEGLYLEFSPDAKTIVAMPSEATGHPALVDPASGDWQVLDALVKPAYAANVWQRAAAGP